MVYKDVLILAEQLQNGQISVTEENGQLGIKQQNGEIFSLEYVNQGEVPNESTSQNLSEQSNVENIEPEPRDSIAQIEQNLTQIAKNIEPRPKDAKAHIEENNRLRALIGLPPLKGSVKNDTPLPLHNGAFDKTLSSCYFLFFYLAFKNNITLLKSILFSIS